MSFCSNSYNLKFCFSSVYWRTFGYTIFLVFLLVCTRINQKVSRRVRKPHTAVHVRSMDFPNLVIKLVAIVPVLCWWSLQRRVLLETGDVWIHSLCCSNKVCDASTMYCLMPVLNQERWLICSSVFPMK